MSNSQFQIAGKSVFVDIDATTKFYSSQNHISEDCPCDDCNHYLNYFIKRPFEILTILSKMGIDLEKNLNSEPTGVWCHVGEDNQLGHCSQTFEVIGSINSSFTYQYREFGYDIKVVFEKIDEGKIFIGLNFQK